MCAIVLDFLSGNVHYLIRSVMESQISHMLCYRLPYLDNQSTKLVRPRLNIAQLGTNNGWIHCKYQTKYQVNLICTNLFDVVFLY